VGGETACQFIQIIGIQCLESSKKLQDRVVGLLILIKTIQAFLA